jgi:uncharacterized protein (TIGR02569 family)
MHVLADFSATDEASRLQGGEGRTYRAGSIVLKPIDDEVESTWVAELFSQVKASNLRIPTPVRSLHGTWVVDGWCAWQWVAGEHDLSGHRPEKLRASKDFHEAVKDIPRPMLLSNMQGPYRRADRIAWDEEPLTGCHPAFRETLEDLARLRKPIRASNQLIHGDMDGNILLAIGEAPAVIDLAPYWRPANYASAIIVADALDWGGADQSIFELVGDIPMFDQLLIRAEMFRIAISDGFHGEGSDRTSQLSTHRETTEMIQDRYPT